MNLSITPSPQFQARQVKVKYNDIKHIPNVPCACCGKKVILPEQLAKILGAVSRPMASIIKSGSMNGWENNKTIWKILQNFAQNNPKQSLTSLMIGNSDEYKQLSGAVSTLAEERCKSTPENTEATRKTLFQSIIANSRNKMRSSSVVMKRMAPLKSYIEGTKLEVFEQLEIYSQKYPRKTLTEIVNMEEIVKFHKMKDLLQRVETKEQIDFHFSNIQKLINSANPQSQEVFDQLKEEALDIFAVISDPQMRMLKIKKLYQAFLKQNNCEKLTNKINKEIDQIPLTYITKDAFFVFAHNHDFDDNKIITSIFNPVISTFEHVIPQSKNGEDRMKNGLVMHKDCNRYRGNLPYEEFFEYHPEMPKNIQKQVNYIARRILEGKLIGAFRFWPMTIAKTLYQYTNGAINLDLTRHCEKGLEDTEQRIQLRNDFITQLKNDRNNKISKKQELQKQIEALEAEMNGLGNVVKELNSENQNEKRLISFYESHIKAQKKSKPE